MNAQGYYRVPECNLDGLRIDIEKLNKKASKLGVEAIHFAVMDWEAVTLTHQSTGIEYIRRYALVDIVGEAPKLAGWSFAAKIEPTEAGNLVKLMPGVENIPAGYYTTEMDCDHCNLNRKRNEVFVVVHDDGLHAQVGRNCLADFLGGTSPETLANIAEWLAEVRAMGDDYDDERGYGTRGIDIGEPTEAFVSAVAAFARFEGYVSKKQAFEKHANSTASRAWWWLRPGNSKGEREERDWLEFKGFAIEERDIALASKAIDWAKNLEPDYSNNFLTNLKVSASLEWADHKTVGILSAIVGAYLREVEKLIREAKTREQAKDLVHLGKVGERVLFRQLTVTNVRSFDGDYGVRTLVSFSDADGNVLTWWTGYKPDWIEVERVVDVKATIKKHDDYRGTPQTVLTRVNEVTA